MSGMREQEMIYATDKSLDLVGSAVRVRQNPEYGWQPKKYKERTIPVPRALMEKLKKMLVKRGKGGLLFPTSSGKPKYDFLDMTKAVAKRAGIPECEVWLHKFRATFFRQTQVVRLSLIHEREPAGWISVPSVRRHHVERRLQLCLKELF